MAVDIETIGVEFDTSGLKKGQAEFDKTTKAADRMADAVDDVGKTSKKSLGEAGTEAGKARQQFEKFASAGVSQFRMLAGALTGLVAVGAGLQKLVATTREMGVMDASLRTATGSADGARVAFSALESLAAQLPESLTDVSTAFTKMVNLGLNPSERALMSYSNTAAAMGKSLMQMVEAVADASTGEFERLKEFGIRAKTEGDKIAFTFRGVTTTVKNSADEITGYLQRIGEVEFAGAAAQRMQTLDGAISNLSDTWDSLFRTISSAGVGDVITSAVRMATEAIADLNDFLQSGEIGAYLDALGIKFRGLLDVVGFVAEQIGALLSGMWEAGRGPASSFFSFIVDSFIYLPENVKAFVQIVGVELVHMVDEARLAGAEMVVALDPSKWFAREAFMQEIARQREIADRARDDSIAAVLAERDASVKAFQDQIAAAKKLGDQFESNRKSATGLGDSLGQFAVQADKSKKSTGGLADEMKRLKMDSEAVAGFNRELAEELKQVDARAQAARDELAAFLDEVIELGEEGEKNAAEFEQFRRSIDGVYGAARKTEEQMKLLNRALSAGQIGIDEYNRLAQKIREAGDEAEDAARRAESSWQDVSESIGDSLTDALMRGFESGKGFAENLKDTVVNLFKSMVVEPAIKNVFASIFSGMSGGGGSGGGGGFNLGQIGSWISSAWSFIGGGTAGGVSWATTMSNISKAWSGITSQFSGIVSQIGSWFGAGTVGAGAGVGTGIGAGGGVGTGIGSGAGVGTGVSSGGAAGGSSIGAIPVVGWILAGMAANIEQWSKGWRYDWEELNTFAKVAFSPMFDAVEKGLQKLFGSDKIASMFSGSAIIQRMFGRRAKQFTGVSGVEGTLGGAGFEGVQLVDWIKKGGWFRGDKRGTDRVGLTGELDKMLDEGAKVAQDMVKEYAAILGLSADRIGQVTSKFAVKITGDAEKDQQAFMDALAGYQEALFGAFGPEVERFARDGESAAEAMMRIAQASQAITPILRDLGVTDEMLAPTDAAMREMFKDLEQTAGNAALSISERFQIIAGRRGGDDTFGELIGTFDGLSTEAQQTVDYTKLMTLAIAAAKAQIVEFSGGLEAFRSNAATYFTEFFSAEEQRAAATRSLTEQLAELGVNTLPATRDEFRALVEAQDLTTESGRQTYAGLLALSGAFASLVPAIDAAAEAAAAEAAAKREQEAAARAAEEAARRAAELANQRNDLEIQLLELQGRSVEAEARRRADILAGLDESLRALQQQIFGQIDQNRAAAEAAAKAAEEQRAAEQAAQEQAQRAAEAQREADEAARRAAEEARRAAEEQLRAARALHDSISDALQSMLGQSEKLVEAERLRAKLTLQNALATAQAGGSLVGFPGLDAALKSVQQIDMGQFGSYVDYLREFGQTVGLLTQLERFTRVDGSHADGLDRVPWDGYVAQLHAGERVQTAAQARDSDSVASEVRALRADLNAIGYAVAKNTQDTAKILNRWEGDGMPETRVVA